MVNSVMTVRHVLLPNCRSYASRFPNATHIFFLLSAFAKAFPNTVDAKFDAHWYVADISRIVDVNYVHQELMVQSD